VHLASAIILLDESNPKHTSNTSSTIIFIFQTKGLLRCPTLKLPKPQAFVDGPACEESLCLRLPDSVYEAQLAQKESLTALIKTLVGLLLLLPYRGSWHRFVH
jgi:hypothetical protein